MLRVTLDLLSYKFRACEGFCGMMIMIWKDIQKNTTFRSLCALPILHRWTAQWKSGPTNEVSIPITSADDGTYFATYSHGKIYRWKHNCLVSIVSIVPSKLLMLHVSDRGRIESKATRTLNVPWSNLTNSWYNEKIHIVVSCFVA